MLTTRVKSMLDGLDALIARDGGRVYPELEHALVIARSAGDDSRVADAALEMGLRLTAMASVARALAERGDTGAELPTPADVLEPAIDLLTESLAAAQRLQDGRRTAFARSRLADAYLQSKQFAKARGMFIDLAASLSLPRDLWLYFDTTQKLGDCGIEMEDDSDALYWYERAMDAARQIDDPFEIQVQHGKIGSALRNLKRYDEAEDHLLKARELLVRLDAEADLREKIVVHRNSFSVDALPALIAYTDRYLDRTRDGLGRELLRDLPRHVGERTLDVIHGESTTVPAAWPVTARLAVAVHSAAGVLEDLLEVSAKTAAASSGADDAGVVLHRVGELTRAHFGADLPDPASLEMAARHLVHVDRSRRAEALAREAADTTLGAGPDYGPGSKHVVYLRSFIASPHLPAWDVPPWGRIDLEELLACQLDRAMLIALGDPDFDRFGPGRVRTTDDNWREALRGLALTAQMLLVLPAMTRGTCWEIEWVVTNKLLHKTCIVMPPSQGAARDWWQGNWAELRRWSVQLGIAMPEYAAQGLLFRLGSEGQFDPMDYRALYGREDLHLALLTGLLMLPNASYDFLYAMQRGVDEERRIEAEAGGASIAPDGGQPGDDAGADPARELLRRLQDSERLEMSDWWRDAPRLPSAPGVLLLYEGPFHLLWVVDCDDLRAYLDDCSEGRANDFTRALFHVRMINLLNGAQTSQLLDGTLHIQDIMRVRVKQLVSYRFLEMPDASQRARAVDRAWQGDLRIGKPELPRPGDARSPSAAAGG